MTTYEPPNFLFTDTPTTPDPLAETNLTLLCLDYLRDLRRSYAPRELWEAEGMDADYFATPTQAQIHLITTAAHPADVFLDWEHLSDKPLTRHPISGETFSILQPPEVSSLAETLKKILALDS